MKKLTQELLQEIIKKCKAAGACDSEFKKLISASTLEKAADVLYANYSWCVNHSIFEVGDLLYDNLSVGGSLDLEGTPITALPDNLSVGGRIYKDF